ncbi:hypothetical protein DICVIV_12411 [Dictyocaulus viviparus]|uniref:Uncharacterized protein n=1 Tax=Dictyocaulus viviparus TaxID=29172 RepID=A0A0D8XCV8_DICVI|nr:hypothetical protein DICVIV_12411 [Dictyocaulus viviparus]
MTDFLSSIEIDWTALSLRDPDAVENHLMFKSFVVALTRLSLTESGWNTLADLALPEVLAQLRTLLQPPKQVFLQPNSINEKNSPAELFVSCFEQVIRLCYAICSKSKWKRLSLKILDVVYSQCELINQLLRAEIKYDTTQAVIDQNSTLKELRIQPHVDIINQKAIQKPYSFVAPNRLCTEHVR